MNDRRETAAGAGAPDAGPARGGGAAEPRSPLGEWLLDHLRRGGFVDRFPWHTAVLARLTPVEDPGVAVMAVSSHAGRFYLRVNPRYFLENPSYLEGVLIHEVNHLVLGHLSHPRFRGVAHPDLMALAMETSANEDIRLPLPPHVCWQDYRSLGLAAGQSTLDRYRLLCAARAAGRPLPIRPTLVDSHDEWSPAALGPDGEAPPDLEGLAAVGGILTDIIEELPASAAARGRLAGRLPGELLEELQGTDLPPRQPVDWRVALHRFVAWERAPVHTFARPNRRFRDQVGVIPGRSYALRTGGRRTVLVALDTSGSMTVAQLEEVARHLRLLAAQARLVVVECDVRIRRCYPFPGRLEAVCGRGGTDLRPPFEPDFLRGQRVDGVVCFTDGCGPYPATPPRLPVLWVLTGDREFGCPWGEQVRLDGGPRGAP